MGRLWSVALGLVVLMASATSAAPLTPSTVGASYTVAGYNVNSLFYGAGLFGNLHSSLISDMWLGDNVKPGSDIPFGSVSAGFNGSALVRSLKIWNFNGGDLSQGAKRIEIRYTSGMHNVSAGIYTLSQGTGGAGGGQIIVLPQDVLASSIQIVFLDNYGNESYVGLSEVQFFSENLLAALEEESGGILADNGGSGGNGTGGSGTGGSGTGGSGTGGSGTVPTGTTPTNVEDIPEPATWVMVAAGVGLLGWRKRRP